MAYRYSLTRVLVFAGMLFAGASTASADCNIPSPDVTCLPGTQAYAAGQAQSQRDEDFKKFMEQGAAAADRSNQNDPGSPYYLGTPAQQCAAAKHSLACLLGISCAPPPDLACAQAEARPARHRHRHQ